MIDAIFSAVVILKSSLYMFLCIVLYFTVLHCTVLHFTRLHCTVYGALVVAIITSVPSINRGARCCEERRRCSRGFAQPARSVHGSGRQQKRVHVEERA